MKEPLPDSTVLIVLVLTLLIVFSIIFSIRPKSFNLQPSIDWRDAPQTTTSEALNI